MINDILQQLISQLPASPTVLDKANIKKIHEYIPVPTDYKIIWADISSFGGYPAGIVITDRALIVKATRDEVKHNNNLDKEQKKQGGSKDKANTVKVIYQIIPWEYYSPEDYEVVAFDAGKGKTRYTLKAGKTELVQFESAALFQLFRKYKKLSIERRELAEATIENSTFSAINTVNVEGVMFNAAYGADQTKTGHGIYAEEAGTVLDRLAGEHATVVGRDNAKNGPDKIVDASPIQCKYCKTAYSSVNSCFKNDPATGTKTFQYYDLSGNVMKIEVPADQYSQAIEYMKTRISNGQVPGVSDPNMAYDIIRKGKITYNQALNLTKAGTIESIAFDMATGAVTCLSAFGISAVATFAQMFWVTKDYKKAAKSALYTGLQVYGLAFAGGIIASQISRTSFAASLNPLATEISKSLSPQMVQEIVNAFRALAGKKAIYGAAAQKSFAKFLGSTAITQGVMFFVFTVPDTYKAISGKISGSQYWKNMTSLVASFTCSIVTTTATGAAIGKTIGENVNKKVGSAIGLVAGVVGGALGGTAVKAIGNLQHEDDAIITARLFNAVLLNQFIDYMLTPEEQDQIITMLDEDEDKLRDLQQSLLKSDHQEQDVIDYLEPKIHKIIKKRHVICAADEAEMCSSINSIVLEGGLAYGV
ncbi:hypothetical protein [Sporofaciens musculi]|uniref:hypothetical protein n=1 Tax=Sporofaciens musculi TaxID=2681861 RepID=UPI00257015BC|nr:hypothetical protein [Sporofaciens musculi]